MENSERSRHSQSRAIEISSLARATPLPVDMGSFGSSSSNKTKLPQLLREQLVDLPSRSCSAELVVIGIGGESAQHCQCVHNATVRHLSDRDIDIEESDERLVPHAQHASRVNQFELCCCLLGLFFWKMLDSPLFRIKGTIHGICHCTHFVISLLSCVGFFGTAARGFIECVKTSKVGTKHAVVKADSMVYLGQFGKQLKAKLY